MASAAAAGGGGGPDGTGRGPALTGSLPPGAPSVVFGLQNYIDKMIKTKDTGPGAIPGMKILILDKDTKGIVSMVYGMSDIVSKEVFHVVNLDAERKGMSHMKAIVYVRPTPENLKLLRTELADPKCMEYHLFFSNIVPSGFLQKLAEADKHFVVKQVHEYYADFYPVNHDFFTINLGSALVMKQPKESSLAGLSSAEAHFQRCVDGIASVLLALKIKPMVRYQQTSSLAFQLGKAVDNLMVEQRAQFTFSNREKPPVLLVLDRKEDPITPLLSQWTYQAMIHECVGLWNNRVDLSKTKEGKKTPEVILSILYDEFFAKHMHSNFGEFAEAVQGILKEYKELKSSHGKVASIEDMQKFVEKYPEIRKKSATVDKHVALMSELNRQLDTRKMFEMSELEQEIACGDNQSEHFGRVKELIADPGLQPFDALRLTAIFAIRYESSATRQISELRAMLGHKGLGDGDIALIDALLQYGGVARRGGDLFGTSGGLLTSWRKSLSRSIAGVQNVFAQHRSLCAQEVEKLMQNKLPKTSYPYCTKALGAKQEPGTVIVYIIGGATFEEAMQVATINATLPRGRRVILGGSAVLNSKSFLAEVRKLAMYRGSGGGAAPGGGGIAAAGGGGEGKAAGRRRPTAAAASAGGSGVFGL